MQRIKFQYINRSLETVDGTIVFDQTKTCKEIFGQRELWSSDQLSLRIPDNLNDTLSWIYLEQFLHESFDIFVLTEHINGLAAAIDNIPKPTTMMYFLLAILLHFR